MVIAIIAGRGGAGKTSQLISIAHLYEPFRWAIMEKKDQRTIGDSGDLIIRVGKDYMTDPVGTLNMFQGWRDTVLATRMNCVVVDGISDLRDYAIEEWVILDNQKRKEDGRALRKAIGADNLGAWMEVNNRVRNLLEPLMNFAFYNQTHLFMTAQMKQVYKDNVRVGEEPDIKEWMEYPVECLLVLKKDKNTDHYWCSCEKAPLWSDGCFQEDLRKGTGLLEVLSVHGLLEMEGGGE